MVLVELQNRLPTVSFAALSTTRKYQTLNEATHELLRENEEARLPQSLAMKMIIDPLIVYRESPVAHTSPACEINVRMVCNQIAPKVIQIKLACMIACYIVSLMNLSLNNLSCVVVRRNNSPTDRTMKALHIVITTTVWLRQPTLFVVGNPDLGIIGHCQKSGCRNSPDRAEEEAGNYDHRGGVTEKEYAANLRYQQESQTELQPVIYPGELTFIVVFAVLILALRIKGNVFTSIQVWYDKICRDRKSVV